MSASPPLRFLAVVLGGWAAVRMAVVIPLGPEPRAGAAGKGLRETPGAKRASGIRAEAPPSAAVVVAVAIARRRPETGLSRNARTDRERPPAPLVPGRLMVPLATQEPATTGPAAPTTVPAPLSLPPRASSGRWSLSAWAFVREGGSAPLATAGLLGASQAGARLVLRLNADRGRPLALSARVSTPLDRPAGAEAALGLDWKPSRRLPVHLLAERRQALGREGRSAFALTLYGGIAESPVGRFRLDAYAQAGLVGGPRADPFGDGSARLSVPLGRRLRLGAGAWGAAQPGLARFDLGPQARVRLPIAGRPFTLQADWRLRIAGNAEPGSGPTLALATDF